MTYNVKDASVSGTLHEADLGNGAVCSACLRGGGDEERRREVITQDGRPFSSVRL
jgi:hypothetical protein